MVRLAYQVAGVACVAVAAWSVTGQYGYALFVVGGWALTASVVGKPQRKPKKPQKPAKPQTPEPIFKT